MRTSIMHATWSLVHEKGPLAITMADVAERAGVSRATLYKNFPSVEAILVTAHGERVEAHLERLQNVVDAAPDAETALTGLLERYAEIAFQRARNGGPDLHGLLHSGGDYEAHEAKLAALFARVIQSAQSAGEVRGDVAAPELAAYCVAALGASGQLPRSSQAGLIRTITSGLRGGGS
ncbi:TetR/AcrR family transcriptional regulator [Microbacterium mangrovi]|uniref:TetR/AcrR family transcriptional regulator n=1 Tax=Microbacterium mangrovi TaxID=1348253 RepID=UPI0018CF00F9|nr:TetR/AcrR family transcriptional regulator [Microbacterium mangrovi]